MAIDWNNYKPITPPANWKPKTPATRSVPTEAHVVGFIRAIEKRVGSASGWRVRARDTGNIYEVGNKKTNGTYDVELLADAGALAEQAATLRRGITEATTDLATERQRVQQAVTHAEQTAATTSAMSGVNPKYVATTPGEKPRNPGWPDEYNADVAASADGRVYGSWIRPDGGWQKLRFDPAEGWVELWPVIASNQQVADQQRLTTLTRADLLTGTAGVGLIQQPGQVLADGSVFDIKPKALWTPGTEPAPNGGTIFDWTPTHIAMRNWSGAVDARWFGVRFDDSDDGQAMQDALDAVPNGGVLYVAGRYRSSIRHIANKGGRVIHIVGDSPDTCYGAYESAAGGGIEILPVAGVEMRHFGIRRTTSYATVDENGNVTGGDGNDHIGLSCIGDGSQNPANHVYDNVALDGWGTGVKFAWLWNSSLRTIHANRCGIGMDVYGQSVNCDLIDPRMQTPRAVGVRTLRIRGMDPITGAAVASEGWKINGGILAGGEICMEISGVMHIVATGTFFDLFGKYGIYASSIGEDTPTKKKGVMTGNHQFHGCYFGASGMLENGVLKAEAAVFLGNSVSDTPRVTKLTGNILTNTRVVPYNNVKLKYGIQATGSESRGDIITGLGSSGVTTAAVQGADGLGQYVDGVYHVNTPTDVLANPVLNVDYKGRIITRQS